MQPGQFLFGADGLDVFDGLPLAGDWTLQIQDHTNSFPNGDNLTAWSIFGSTEQGPFDIAGPIAFNVDQPSPGVGV